MRIFQECCRRVCVQSWKKDSYPVLPIFRMLQEEGNIAEEMMYNTFNMGLGMIIAVDPADVDKTMEAIKAAGDTAICSRLCGSRRERCDLMLRAGSSGIRRRHQSTGDHEMVSQIGSITNAKIVTVISNNKNAYALTRAEQAGIPASCISPKDHAAR